MEPWGFTLELIPFTGNIADNGSMPQKIEKKSKAETRFLAIFFYLYTAYGKTCRSIKVCYRLYIYIESVNIIS